MNLFNAPHVFNYQKISDCALPEGRVSIPFGFQLQTNTAQTVPVPIPSLNGFVGEFYKLDLTSIQNGVKGLTGIKSLEIDAQFFAGFAGGFNTTISKLFIIVEDSQQVFTLQPSNHSPLPPSAVNPNGGSIRAVFAITSNSPTKIWFILDGTSVPAGGNPTITVNAKVNNFEMEPSFSQSIF